MTTQKSARRKGLYNYPKKIGKLLEEWYYPEYMPQSKGKILYPTIGSGSFGKKRPDLSAQRGDLCPIDKWTKKKPWTLCLELKHRKEWSFEQVLQKPEANFLFDYWDQVYEDSVDKPTGQPKYLPLLIVTKNYGKDYVLFDKASWGCLSNLDNPMSLYNAEGRELGVMLLKDFIAQTSVDEIIAEVKLGRKALREYKKELRNGN